MSGRDDRAADILADRDDEIGDELAEREFYVTAYYKVWSNDEPDMTADDLASRMRGWGFTAVDVEDEGA